MGFRVEISEELNKKIKKLDKSTKRTLYSYIKKESCRCGKSKNKRKSIDRKFKRALAV